MDVLKKNIDSKTIGFLHVPSCGGTTMWSIFKNIYPGKAIRIKKGRSIEDNIQKLSESIKLTEQDVHIIGGHIPVDAINNFRPRYTFSLMRDPVETIISKFFRFIRNEKLDISTFDNTFEVLIDFARNKKRSMARLLFGNDISKIEKIIDNGEMVEDKIKQEILQRFHYILITEYFDQSLLLLANDLEWEHLPLYDKRNQGGNKIDIPDVIKQEIRDIILVDETVYRVARKMHEERWGQCPKSLRVKAILYSLKVRTLQILKSIVSPASKNKYVKR